MANIYILTDHAEFGGTHTWVTNVSFHLKELNIEHKIINTMFCDFKYESTIILNNYNHKIFQSIDKNLLSTLKFYFVVHGIPNPSNSYFIENIDYFYGIICVSETILEKTKIFVNNMYPHKNFIYHVLQNYIQPNLKITNNISQSVIFNFVGRVSPEKNLPMLFYALSVIDKTYSNWFLNIWGNMSNKKFILMLNQIIEKIGIQNKVLFRGFTTDKTKLYSNCSYVILPSVIEGSSYTVIESLSYGVPIIACSNVGDNDCQIKHGENGYLINLETSCDSQITMSCNGFNQCLTNVGYVDAIIFKNIDGNCVTINRNVISVPPMHYGIIGDKLDLFNKNINNMAQTLKLAIENKLFIEPQTNIDKNNFILSLKNIFHVQ